MLSRTDIGLFSSLAFFLGGGGSTDSALSSGKQPTAEEQEAIKVASACIEECHIEQLLQETKFLIIDSLNELLKALIYGCQIPPDAQKLDEDAAVFCLELLVKVVLQNRDRVTTFWPTVRQQFYSILINANERSFFIERTCIGLLRIAARLLRREELATEVREHCRGNCLQSFCRSGSRLTSYASPDETSRSVDSLVRGCLRFT